VLFLLESFLTRWAYPAYTNSRFGEVLRMLWPDTNGKAWTVGNVLFLIAMGIIGLILMALLYLTGPEV